MDMRRAIIATLADSGGATFICLIGVTCEHADDFNVNLLPSVLYQLILEGRVVVDCGVYSAKK